jgi:predicted alpha/beta hydrolase
MSRYISLRNYDWVPELRHIADLRFVIEANSATALAQHHGIPTRFLDWTRSAATAAFFAASDVDEPSSGKSIAVWALRPDYLVVHGALAVSGEDARRFLVYEVPRSENAYLRAQDGLFVYPAAACMHYIRYGDWPSLEDFAVAVAQVAGEPAIKKYTLPTSHVGELLRLLWLDGVSRAHLMPTFDNVTAALVSKWKWHS